MRRSRDTSNRTRRGLAAVVRFMATSGWPLAPVASPPAAGRIPDCPSCGSAYLCPAAWEAEDAGHWRIQLRCGSCGAWTHLLLDNRQAAALDVAVDRQADAIRAAANALDRERMAEQAATFAAALRAGLITASDF